MAGSPARTAKLAPGRSPNRFGGREALERGLSGMKSWRGRRLKQEGVVPSLFSGFAQSLETYLWGTDLRSFRLNGGWDSGTFADRMAGKIPGETSTSVRQTVDRYLKVEYGASLHSIFSGPDEHEKVRTDGLFDLIEFLIELIRAARLDEMEAEFVGYLNRLFERENQPYEVRDGRVLVAEQPDQVEIMTGLAALAPTAAIASDLKKAELAFFDPRDDRRDEGLLLMARAYDAAKRSEGGPKQTFERLLARSFVVPAGARPEAVTASTTLFDNIATVANEIVRHGGPDKIDFATDEMKAYWFFVLASTIRLLYTRPEPAAKSERAHREGSEGGVDV